MCDFLPSAVHKILDNVEFSLSLPMLLVIVVCTIHLAVNHSRHILCNVKEIMRKRAEMKCRKPPVRRKCPGPSILDRIKAIAACILPKKSRSKCDKPKKCAKKKPACKRNSCAINDLKSTDDDWDDEEDEEDLDDILLEE